MVEINNSQCTGKDTNKWWGGKIIDNMDNPDITSNVACHNRYNISIKQ